MFAGKLTNVCMTGSVINDKFVHAKDTNMGTITRASMMKIMGITNHDLLTVDLVIKHHTQLKVKLLPKVKQNLSALYNQLMFISRMPDLCKSFRISSTLLPLFDHPVLVNIYDQELHTIISKGLARCKSIIDQHNITVSCHPDQYCIINSTSKSVRENSFRTLNYHKYFMSQLTTPERSCINIHLEGNLDHIPEFDTDLDQHTDLIPWLSFENSDKNGKVFTGNTQNTLKLCQKYNIKMLFDLHHHVVLEGSYLDLYSDTFVQIIDTWNGQTPFFHASQSRESGVYSRSHSDLITDEVILDQIKHLLAYGYVDIEAKYKTDAVLGVYSRIYQE